MDPNIKTENKTTDPEKDAKYAEALVAMSNMEMKMQQAHEPKRKSLISKKKLIYVVVSIVLTILSLLMTPGFFKSASHSSSDKQTEQKLLDGADELKDLQNQ